MLFFMIFYSYCQSQLCFFFMLNIKVFLETKMFLVSVHFEEMVSIKWSHITQYTSVVYFIVELHQPCYFTLDIAFIYDAM